MTLTTSSNSFPNKRRALLVAALLVTSASSVLAAFPDRPIKLLVPWSAGGATDQVARMLAQPLSLALGVPVVVENRGGAGGVIGTAIFVKEKADGYSLLMATSSTNAAAPHLFSKLGFDPVADFTPVTSVCLIPNVMVVPTKSPWNTLQDIVSSAKQSSGKFTYGSAGIGGSQHLAGSQFKKTANIEIRHIPYKGSGPAAQDLIAGHIDMMIDTGSLGTIRGGLLKPIAVASEKRLQSLPNVPTFREAGLPMLASAWYGIMLPAGAPKDVTERLSIEFNKILKSPDIKKRLNEMGAEVLGSTPQEFASFSASEIKRYEEIVKDSGAQKE